MRVPKPGPFLLDRHVLLRQAREELERRAPQLGPLEPTNPAWMVMEQAAWMVEQLSRKLDDYPIAVLQQFVHLAGGELLSAQPAIGMVYTNGVATDTIPDWSFVAPATEERESVTFVAAETAGGSAPLLGLWQAHEGRLERIGWPGTDGLARQEVLCSGRREAIGHEVVSLRLKGTETAAKTTLQELSNREGWFQVEDEVTVVGDEVEVKLVVTREGAGTPDQIVHQLRQEARNMNVNLAEPKDPQVRRHSPDDLCWRDELLKTGPIPDGIYLPTIKWQTTPGGETPKSNPSVRIGIQWRGDSVPPCHVGQKKIQARWSFPHVVGESVVAAYDVPVGALLHFDSSTVDHIVGVWSGALLVINAVPVPDGREFSERGQKRVNLLCRDVLGRPAEVFGGSLFEKLRAILAPPEGDGPPFHLAELQMGDQKKSFDWSGVVHLDGSAGEVLLPAGGGTLLSYRRTDGRRGNLPGGSLEYASGFPGMKAAQPLATVGGADRESSADAVERLFPGPEAHLILPADYERLFRSFLPKAHHPIVRCWTVAEQQLLCLGLLTPNEKDGSLRLGSSIVVPEDHMVVVVGFSDREISEEELRQVRHRWESWCRQHWRNDHGPLGSRKVHLLPLVRMAGRAKEDRPKHGIHYEEPIFWIADWCDTSEPRLLSLPGRVPVAPDRRLDAYLNAALVLHDGPA